MYTDNKLTVLALTAKCSLNAVINPKEVEASSFCGGTESTFKTVVVDFGPLEVLVVWHEFQVVFHSSVLN